MKIGAVLVISRYMCNVNTIKYIKYIKYINLRNSEQKMCYIEQLVFVVAWFFLRLAWAKIRKTCSA